MHNRRWLGILLLLFTGVSLLAQGQGVYRLGPGDFVAGSLGLGWAISGHVIQARVEPFDSVGIATLNQSDVPAIDRANIGVWRPAVARVSDICVPSLLLGSGALLLTNGFGDNWRCIVVMGLETSLWSYGSVNAVKGIVQRTRPFAYGTEAPMEERLKNSARLSFLSGHTTFSAAACFFAAKVFHDLHPDSRMRKWVWAGATVAPIAVAALRVGAGKHFLSDVAAGYLLGAGIGWLVPQLHKIGSKRQQMSLSPAAFHAGAGLALNWRF